MASKLKKPEFTTDESGRRVYAGSLAQMSTELSEKQKASILKALKDGPQMPSALVASTEGLSIYNPHSAEAIRRYLAELELGGHVRQVKNERRLLGWQAVEDEKPDDEE